MTLQEPYDDAMFDFSQGRFDQAIAKLNAVLAADPAHFDAQLALGMAWYRLGNLPAAIVEGHKAEKLRPKEQLVHTNLSLFYMKSGDKVTAEHHGLQARIAGWREDAAKAKDPGAQPAGDPELEIAGAKPQPVKLPPKFPDQPWKKKGGSGGNVPLAQ
jgi:tetratricopeptide (TPR) repeat protein